MHLVCKSTGVVTMEMQQLKRECATPDRIWNLIIESMFHNTCQLWCSVLSLQLQFWVRYDVLPSLTNSCAEKHRRYACMRGGFTHRSPAPAQLLCLLDNTVLLSLDSSMWRLIHNSNGTCSHTFTQALLQACGWPRAPHLETKDSGARLGNAGEEKAEEEEQDLCFRLPSWLARGSSGSIKSKRGGGASQAAQVHGLVLLATQALQDGGFGPACAPGTLLQVSCRVLCVQMCVSSRLGAHASGP